ncbi:MAG: hypothetical protein IPJ03_14265 [Ignavibacteriales bacterium]|nr:hypothetical protein [Ignavibacteriales bacterium]
MELILYWTKKGILVAVMVISHKYKYLFVESPITGSTAISAELREKYDGKEILRKHSRYYEFLNVAGKETANNYFVFSTIRNPLDAQVSAYFKYKTNHQNRFTIPTEWKRYGGSLSEKDLRIYKYVKKHNLDFSGYFKKYIKLPYDTWARLSHKNFNYLIRYENIQQDFTEVLKRIGIQQDRPLPEKNKTTKDKNFLEIYDPSIRQRAVNIFGPFMKEWGFEFPKEWGEIKISPFAQIEYEIVGFMKSIYWRLTPKSNAVQRKKLLGELQQLKIHS